MSMTAVDRYADASMEVLERVVIAGDLGRLAPADRVAYYQAVCRSVGINPFTKPFDYIQLNGRLTLYATKTATDQLRTIHGISVHKLEREQTADSYDVTAYGRTKDGREDSSLGSVPIAGLKGEALSNAKMKAETKAKRRLTLSLAGLGWLDETEVGSVPTAQTVNVDTETGEIVAATSAPRPVVPLAERAAARRAEVEARATDAAASSPQPAEEVPTAGGTASSAAPDEPDLLPASSEVEPVVPSGAAPSEATCGSPSPYDDGGSCNRTAGHAERIYCTDGRATWPRPKDWK